MNSVELDLVIGILGVVLFKFTNHTKRFTNWISAFVLGLFLSQILYLLPGGDLLGQIIWVISSLGLLWFYFLRFNSIPNKKVIDFLKPIGVVLLIIYPLPFYRLVHVGDNDFWIILRSLTPYLVGTIFIYDRWIFKSETMKKKIVLILVIQSVLILLVLTFVLYQKSQADIATERAVELAREAEKASHEVVRLKYEFEKAKEDSLKKQNP